VRNTSATERAVKDWHLRSADLDHTAFDALGVYPVLGRPFNEADSRDTPFAVLLGYDVWQTRFGGDPNVIDRSVQIPGTMPEDRWRVVGIMPRGFSFPDGANFWIPVYPFYFTPPVMPYARLAPGVTVEAFARSCRTSRSHRCARRSPPAAPGP
jgi:hypothetical protein